MVDILVKCVQVLAFTRLSRCKHYSGSILQAVLTHMLLDKVKVFLEQLGLLTMCIDHIDFVAKDYNRDAKVDLQHAFTKRHLQTHIHLIITAVRVIFAAFALLFVLNYEVAVVIKLWFLVGQNMALNFFLHFLEQTNFHLRYDPSLDALGQLLQPRP